MRRQVIKSPELTEFRADLKKALPPSYRINSKRHFGLSIVERGVLVDALLDMDDSPEAEDIENAADTISRGVRENLHDVPRRLDVPLGGVFRFGKKKNKLGVVPLGWAGFSAPYAEKDSDKNILPNPVIVRESNTAVGALVNIFGGEGGIDTTSLANRTPHITFAQKEKGGPITDNELAHVAGSVGLVQPDYLTVFDPAIFLSVNNNGDTEVLRPRSPRHGQNADIIDL